MSLKCTDCGSPAADGYNVKFSPEFGKEWTEPKPYCRNCARLLNQELPNGMRRMLMVKISDSTKLWYTVSPHASSSVYKEV